MTKAQAKGAATITDAIYIVISVAIAVAAIFLFITENFTALARQIALESAEVVAKDTAGFITVSGAAPDEARIIFKPSTKFKYDLEVSGRIVEVKSLLDNEYTEGPSFFGFKPGPFVWSEKAAVDPEASFKSIDTIVISKVVANGQYVYQVSDR